MNTKNLILSFVMMFCLLSALSLVSANVLIEYDLYESTMNADGSYTDTIIALTNFDVVGYICADAACNTVTSTFLTDTSVASGTDYQILFPTIGTAQYYGVYFSKTGWIHWEEALTLAGTQTSGVVDGAYTIYLTRKATGWAPIMNLSVEESVLTNRPVEVNVNIAIDADTYSAIDAAGPLTYANIENSISLVETEVTLEIIDTDDADVIYTDTQTVNIPYSSSLPVSFTYPGFSVTGDYEIVLTTDVTDDKILLSVEQEATSDIEVIAPGLDDYGYSIVGNLEMTPTQPDAGDSIDFSFDFESHYIDASDVSSEVDTRIEVTIFRDGDEIEDFVISNQNAGTETFSRTYTTTGSYRIEVYAEPEDEGVVEDKRLIGNTQSITFVVGEPSSSNGGSDDDDDDEDDEENELLLTLAPSSTSGDGDVLDLRGTSLTALEKLQLAIKWLLWLILFILVVIALVYLIKSWFWILVGIILFLLVMIGIVKLSWLLVASLIALTILIIAGFFNFLR